MDLKRPRYVSDPRQHDLASRLRGPCEFDSHTFRQKHTEQAEIASESACAVFRVACVYLFRHHAPSWGGLEPPLVSHGREDMLAQHWRIT